MGVCLLNTRVPQDEAQGEGSGIAAPFSLL